MTIYKYQQTYYIKAPKGTDLRAELGIRFEDTLLEVVQQRVEKELNYEITLEVNRITEEAPRHCCFDTHNPELDI